MVMPTKLVPLFMLLLVAVTTPQQVEASMGLEPTQEIPLGIDHCSLVTLVTHLSNHALAHYETAQLSGIISCHAPGEGSEEIGLANVTEHQPISTTAVDKEKTGGVSWVRLMYLIYALLLLGYVVLGSTHIPVINDFTDLGSLSASSCTSDGPTEA